MSKEIIGYKFKPECEKYMSAAIVINGDKTDYLGDNAANYLAASAGAVILRLKEAGVFDIWFEPVYCEIETPVVQGYRATYDKFDNVIYFNKKPFYVDSLRTLYDLQLHLEAVSFRNGLTMSINDIEKILKYCDTINKK